MRRAERAGRLGAHRIERSLQRDAEIGEHWAARAAVEEDVLRLEVAVNYTFAMRVVEGQRQLVQDAARVLRRQNTLRAQTLAE